MRGAAKKAASEELERRSQYLSSLVQRTKIMGDNAAAAADHDKKEVVEATAAKPERREQFRQCSQQRMQEKEVVEERREKKKGVGDGGRCVGDQQQQKEEEMNVKVRAADMSPALQKHAFRCARETLTSMPKLESKRLALALKKARPCPSMPSFPYRSSGSIIIIYFSFLKWALVPLRSALVINISRSHRSGLHWFFISNKF
ncbi:dynein light chain [Musa troglodytarum]|uniref:Dynein light chain n=1 Tax=Musa troglodytarum TaxID=320322 RepID=A0A9E7HLB0_9LILI|nr:dynein light chain [Musa troglodytarum]